jgi:hypothetical protein
MADYQPLIARAVAGLEKNTGENRRALYERARNALVAQLRGVSPALEESEITKERLALEEAIRKVEAETARNAREAARPAAASRRAEARRDISPQPADDEAQAASRHDTGPANAEIRKRADVPTINDAPPAAPLTNGPVPTRPGYADAPRRLVGETFHGRSEAAHSKAAAEARHAEQEAMRMRPPPQSRAHPLAQPARDPVSVIRPSRPPMSPEALSPPPQETGHRGAVPPRAPEPPHFDEYDHPNDEPMQPLRPHRLYRHAIRAAIIAAIVIGLGATLYWQSSNLVKLGQGVMALVRPAPPPPREAAEPARPKMSDRLGQPSPTSAETLAVAQRVVLYEEDPGDPQGRRFSGTAVWRTEMKPAASGRPPELAVRADIEVPDRRMAVTWSLRRNTDPSLPASHTIEIAFNVPSEAGSGGVQNVPGVLMKQAEQTRGVPLAGLAVKVTPGFFLIGLSALEADVQRNVQMLKERTWFDIPIVYNNNRRAILAVEKGTPGEKVFSEVFGSWRQ